MRDHHSSASCRIDVSAVRRVATKPRTGPAFPTSTARPFTAVQLRAGMARFTVRLSRRRRVAATVPLVAALVTWFVVPSAAADFRLDAAGDRYGTISHGIGGRNSYPIHVPGFGNENAGTLLMHQVGGGDVEAYCVDLHGVRNPAAVFSSGERRIDQVAYILNHNFPVGRDAGAMGDVNLEAAAVQLAVWTFSDGVNLDKVTAPAVAGFPAVINRARQIVQSTAANWAAWAAQQSVKPSIGLRAGPQAAAPGETPLTASVSGGPSGGIPDGTPITFTVTTPEGTVDGKRTTTKTLSGGATTVQIGSSNPGVVGVRAQVTVNGLAYLQLNPSIRPNQTLILASQLPVSGEGAQNATFTGSPHLTVTKTVASTGAPASTVEAKPGDTIKYTISYANTGTAAATAASIHDDLSQGELKRLPAAGIALAGGRERALGRETRVAAWNLGDIPPGGAGTVDLEAHLPAGLPDDGKGIGMCNTATISSGEVAPVASNAACAHITTTPHLLTVKVVDAGQAKPGQTLRYTISVQNDGSRDLTGVTVTDTLRGNNLDLLTDITPAGGGSYDAGTRTLSWAVAALAAGATSSVAFDATIPTTGLPTGETCFVNTAVAGGPNTGGPYPSGPVSACAHHPTPAATPTPAPSPAPTPAATPTPGAPGLPVAGSGPMLVTDQTSGSGPAAAALGSVHTAAQGSRQSWRNAMVSVCLLISGLILVTGMLPRRRVMSGL